MIVVRQRRAALRILGQVVDALKVGQLGWIDLLEQASLDGLLAEAVGEIGDVHTAAIADLVTCVLISIRLHALRRHPRSGLST